MNRLGVSLLLLSSLGLVGCQEANNDASPDAGLGGGGGEGEGGGGSGELSCEDTSSDPMNCGLCGRTCIIPNAISACEASECVLAECADGFDDEDGLIDNGCEAGGSSQEEPIEEEEEMPLMCMEGAPELCNAFDDDCNGSCDEGLAGQCRQGIHRSSGNGHLYTTDLAAAQATPFNLEAQNYFRLYAEEGEALEQVFLCRKSNGKHLLTDDANCEGLGAAIANLGYWAKEAQCGSVPLYRLHEAGSNNHFYTLSAGERDNAANNLGYTNQGIAGYVWTSP